MAILDLQGLDTPQKMIAGKSGGSKGCTIGGGGGGSRLSLLLC